MNKTPLAARMNHDLARGTTSTTNPMTHNMNHHDQNTELLTAYALSVRLQTTMQDVFRIIATGRVRTRVVGGERLIVWPALRLVVSEERAA